MQQTYALSFKDLKQRITIEQVLRHYNLFETLERKGKSHRGSCPFCEAQESSPFSVSLEKNCYQCFYCNASGNILDFVMQWEGVKIREAGEILAEHFVRAKAPQESHEETHKKARTAESKPPPAEEADPPAREAGERPDKMTSLPAKAGVVTPAADIAGGESTSRNEPLTFGLKNIESDHPSVRALLIHEDTITSFGVGYYSGRGMMGNHIVIPIYNSNRQLIAYAGLHPEEHTYTYPPQFRRELELYNLGGALTVADDEHGLILVRQPLEALMLVSAGSLNAIAIMGEDISKEQVALLLDTYGAGEKVTLFWSIRADVVPTLSDLLPHFFVRIRRYEESGDTSLRFTAKEAGEILL